MSLLQRVTKTPVRKHGTCWYDELTDAQRKEIAAMIRAKRDGKIQHSIQQLAALVIEEYSLTCKQQWVARKLTELFAEAQS